MSEPITTKCLWLPPKRSAGASNTSSATGPAPAGLSRLQFLSNDS